jgi:putative flippase GtrA
MILKQLIRFCLVGLANTAIDFTIYISLTRVWDFGARWYLVANLIAFVLANIFSFIINKSWTFENLEYRNYYLQYLRFFIVSIGSLIIVEAILFFFVDILQVYDLWGKVVGIVLSLIWSFFWHRNWTFK